MPIQPTTIQRNSIQRPKKLFNAKNYSTQICSTQKTIQRNSIQRKKPIQRQKTIQRNFIQPTTIQRKYIQRKEKLFNGEKVGNACILRTVKFRILGEKKFT
jgi:hypothetical protein